MSAADNAVQTAMAENRGNCCILADLTLKKFWIPLTLFNLFRRKQSPQSQKYFLDLNSKFTSNIIERLVMDRQRKLPEKYPLSEKPYRKLFQFQRKPPKKFFRKTGFAVRTKARAEHHIM